MFGGCNPSPLQLFQRQIPNESIFHIGRRHAKCIIKIAIVNPALAIDMNLVTTHQFVHRVRVERVRQRRHVTCQFIFSGKVVSPTLDWHVGDRPQFVENQPKTIFQFPVVVISQLARWWWQVRTSRVVNQVQRQSRVAAITNRIQRQQAIDRITVCRASTLLPHVVFQITRQRSHHGDFVFGKEVRDPLVILSVGVLESDDRWIATVHHANSQLAGRRDKRPELRIRFWASTGQVDCFDGRIVF